MTLHSEKKKKADSDFVYSHGTPWLCPTFISCAEKKTALKHWPGLLRKLHLPIMKQSARVCVQMQALEEDTVFAH